jgi:hypothetical protein
LTVLRDLLASLWAALWLHARLLGLRVRRLFGGGSVPGSGADYHLTKAETPVEGIDYDPIDLPPELKTRLHATRADLLARVPGAADGGTRRRATRRRTASAVATSLLALGVVAAGASALVTGSTGVSAVDRVLGIYEKGAGDQEASGGPRPTTDDARPDPSRASASVNAVVADGSRVVSTSYAASSGRVCTAITDVGELDRRRVLGALPCQEPAFVADHMEQAEGYVMGASIWGDSVVVSGFVSDRFVSMTSGEGPGGPVDVVLGETWAPGLPELAPMKPFVAVGKRGDKASQRDGDLWVLNPENYIFDATTDSGERVQIKP